ncbi:hypothetical protein EB796_013800 [Bugula neritina]|uniref:Metalloendopeptidase n=1 Tax=Bugula neritina TaxID=10212 RepID=A0A7J7JNH8_BUGNE|nr:hypothetical protein EB796_013800 [Bugula neritina]
MRIFYYILYLVILHVSFFCTFPTPSQAKYSGLQTKQLSVLQRKKRAATADQSRLWPNATIPYEFDKGLPKNLKNLLQNAIHHWENKTCIDFVPKLKHHKDYVVFTTESCGCCSSVGKIGGRQTLSLSSYCASESVAIHELGHVVGFWHEHTRPDRDSYITVLWNNIYKDLHKNFFKRNSFEVNSFGRPYDFASIMHYGPRTFSNGKGDTMVAINGEKMSHQSASLSTEDIIQTQLLYQCPEPECEFLISASTRGRITSPYYPSHYTANVDCQWTVVVPEGI